MASYFHKRWGFTQCVENSTTELPHWLLQQKGLHSIILQGVVDGKGLFCSVLCAGVAWSVHDAQVLRLSTLWDFVARGGLYRTCTQIIGGKTLASTCWGILPALCRNGSSTYFLTKAGWQGNSKPTIGKHPGPRLQLKMHSGDLWAGGTAWWRETTATLNWWSP